MTGCTSNSERIGDIVMPVAPTAENCQRADGSTVSNQRALDEDRRRLVTEYETKFNTLMGNTDLNPSTKHQRIGCFLGHMLNNVHRT